MRYPLLCWLQSSASIYHIVIIIKSQFHDHQPGRALRRYTICISLDSVSRFEVKKSNFSTEYSTKTAPLGRLSTGAVSRIHLAIYSRRPDDRQRQALKPQAIISTFVNSTGHLCHHQDPINCCYSPFSIIKYPLIQFHCTGRQNFDVEYRVLRESWENLTLVQPPIWRPFPLLSVLAILNPYMTL